MNRVIFLLLIMVLVGCSRSLDIQLEPEVHMFFSNDAEQRIRITQKDEVYVVLSAWLNENRAGWYATSGRYPGGVYVKSGDNGIQITESKVVIYSTTGNEPKAIYIQDIQKGELSRVVSFAK